MSCAFWSLNGRTERVRWTSAQSFYWQVLPELTSFSAMRLLHFATPSVVAADVFAFMEYSSTRAPVAFEVGREL